MPTITSSARPTVTATTEDSFRNPTRQMKAESTGVSYGNVEAEAQQAPEQTQSTTNEETAPKEVTLSPQLTALARKEQTIRKQEQALKAEREALAKEREQLSKWSQLDAKLKSKDFSALDELGINYDEYTQYQLSRLEGEKPEMQAVKALEAKLAQFEESQKTQVNKQYEATIAQYKKDISNLVQSPDFEAVKTMGAEDHVLQHIIDTFNEDGEVLTVEEACKEIEELLVEEAEKMAGLKKVQAKLAPQAPEKSLPPPQKSSGLKTLTNQMSQVTPSVPRNQFQHMSMKERLLKAVELANKNQR